MKIFSVSRPFDAIRLLCRRIHQIIFASDFFRMVVETFTTRIVVIGLGMISSIIVARILGPAGRGTYAIAASLCAIGIQFGNLGLHSSNTYYVAKNPGLLPSLIGNTLIISLGIGGFIAITSWGVFSLYPSISPVDGPLLAIALIMIPLGLSYLLFQNLMLGILEVRTYNLIESASPLLSLAFMGGVILTGKVNPVTIFGVGLLTLIINITWILTRLRDNISKPPFPSFPLFQETIRYGIKAYFAALFAFLVLRIDLFMIKYMIGDSATGYYSISVGMGNLLFTLPTVVGTILFPKLSTPQSMRDRWNLTFKTAYSVGAIMLIACIVMFFLAKNLIVLLYGIEYLPASTPFIIISFGILIWSVESIFRKLLNTDPIKGFRMEVVYIWAAVLPINIGMNYFFIPILGINGAAMASAISLFLIAICVFILVIKEYHKTILTTDHE